ncbi:MAG: FUSC family protein [Corynebacterium sp.]|nr:FUSC family protein [Corynebacterium sp.]
MRGQELINSRVTRVRASWRSIIQGGAAAGLAYFLAHNVMGHEEPFFAPMAAVIVLGITGDGRLRRALELDMGVAIGVGFGSFFVNHVGTGLWQMPVMVMIALAIALFIDKSVIVFSQAALGAVLIATILPPGSGGGGERMFDALVGGLCGVLVIALIPTSPLKGARLEVSRVFGLIHTSLMDVHAGLMANDPTVIREALAKVRGCQASINMMLAKAQEGHESMMVSPLLWRQRKRVNDLVRILNPVDNAMRNTRVLTRRALILVEDGEHVSRDQLAIIEELATIAHRLQDMYTTDGDIDEMREIPVLESRLKILGAHLGLEVAEGRGLSAQAILAQTRSLTVDLMVVTGMSRREAQSHLKPVNQHPHVAPDIYEGVSPQLEEALSAEPLPSAEEEK